jgi:ribosomal protein S18 acetylase RimI-like enzyme
MNDTYTDIYGFIPLTDDFINRIARTYMEIVDPRLVKVVVNENDEIASFILGIRDITGGFQKAGGKLIPFGYFIIKSAQKKSRRLDLLLGAIRKEYRGKGLDTLMAIAMLNSAREMGMDVIDSHHELESNQLVQAEMRRAGGVIYKRHRVYRKKM